MAGFGLGGNELLIIILAAGLLFMGGKKIPELAKGLGRAMGEFQRGRKEITNEIGGAFPTDEDPPGARTEPPARTNVKRLKAEPPKPDDAPTQESRVVKAARALGIDTEGKSEDELKKEIAKIANG